MDVDRLTVALEHHARLLSEAAQGVDLETDVPSCPGWSVRDLIVHTGVVHRHKTEVVRGGYLNAAPDEPPEPSGDVIAWYDEGVEEMLAVFDAADLDAPTWTWCGHDHNAEWWVRRMAHESLIHGADALLAASQMPTADAWLAADGVDEILDEMMTGPSRGVVEPGVRRVDLVTEHRTWGLRSASLSGTSPNTGRTPRAVDIFARDGSGAADATVRVDSETLDFWLWGRRELPTDSIEGDRSLVDQLRATAAESTQ
jgi:uncharacterized protein (TIGR03083 family)